MVTMERRDGFEFEDAGTCPSLEEAIELAVQSFTEDGLDCDSIIILQNGRIIGKVTRQLKNRRVRVSVWSKKN